MLRLARFCALTALLAALWAQPALAARLVLPETVTSSRFQIHFHGDPTAPATPVTFQMAAELAGNLERAYDTVVTDWGYPAPLSDGDAYVDVYVTDLDPLEVAGLAFPETAANQTYGYIQIDDELTDLPSLAMHEFFHLVQYGIWQPMDDYLLEGTAEWAGFRFVGFPLAVDLGGANPIPLVDLVGAPEMSLTCDSAACGLDDYERFGYSRWHFYEYLTERFGNSTVNDVFQKGKSLADPALTGSDLLALTLTAKGASLSDVFNDWTVANMTGGYTATGLKSLVSAAYSTTTTGAASGTLPVQKIPVNHLAARYVAFKRGAGTTTGPCYSATLSLTVTVPSGLGARPYFRWTAAGSPAIPFVLSGTTGTLSVPWDTCTWADSGLVSLPNPSASVDAALFTVSGSVTVDKTSIATSTPPPAGTYTGPTILAPTGEVPPSIAIYGPETLRVSKKLRVVRLVVFSSGGGKLEAELGNLRLGTRTLRTGNNDVRFTLPKTVTRTLAATSKLSFTSLSTTGTRGDTVTRKLVLTK